ncbi:MAG: TlpA family protein disulfide reductase [Myxococcales bacterium]|nr:TlpA family protein disulfide reductase [Myxococcales bacterium]
MSGPDHARPAPASERRGMGPWLVAAVVVGAAVFAVVLGPDAPPPVIRGSVAPGFELSRVDGGAPVTLEGLRGKVVLLNFWATWCKPCEDEMPAMERLHRELAASGFALLAISVDDSVEPVQAFRKRLGLTFPVLHDVEKDVSETYQAFRFPESLLVDAEGVVVERYIGPKEWDAPSYVDRVRRLLAAKPTS